MSSITRYFGCRPGREMIRFIWRHWPRHHRHPRRYRQALLRRTPNVRPCIGVETYAYRLIEDNSRKCSADDQTRVLLAACALAIATAAPVLAGLAEREASISNTVNSGRMLANVKETGALHYAGLIIEAFLWRTEVQGTGHSAKQPTQPSSVQTAPSATI